MPVVHTLIVRVYRCLPGRLGLRGQRWRLKALASNGRVVATSGEAYTNESDCLRGPNNQIVVRS